MNAGVNLRIAVRSVHLAGEEVRSERRRFFGFNVCCIVLALRLGLACLFLLGVRCCDLLGSGCLLGGSGCLLGGGRLLGGVFRLRMFALLVFLFRFLVKRFLVFI